MVVEWEVRAYLMPIKIRAPLNFAPLIFHPPSPCLWKFKNSFPSLNLGWERHYGGPTISEVWILKKSLGSSIERIWGNYIGKHMKFRRGTRTKQKEWKERTYSVYLPPTKFLKTKFLMTAFAAGLHGSLNQTWTLFQLLASLFTTSYTLIPPIWILNTYWFESSRICFSSICVNSFWGRFLSSLYAINFPFTEFQMCNRLDFDQNHMAGIRSPYWGYLYSSNVVNLKILLNPSTTPRGFNSNERIHDFDWSVVISFVPFFTKWSK